MLIDEMVTKECERLAVKRADHRFSRRDVREWTGWGNTQLKLHLHRLEELEYLLLHRGGRGQSFVYELLYDGQGKDGTPFLAGLLDVDTLRREYDGQRSGLEGNLAGSSRPQVGGVSGGGRDELTVTGEEESIAFENINAETALIGEVELNPSYRTYGLPLRAARNGDPHTAGGDA